MARVKKYDCKAILNRIRVRRCRLKKQLLDDNYGEKKICQQFRISTQLRVNEDSNTSLRDKLKMWASNHRVTSRAINDLLTILNSSGEFYLFNFIIIIRRMNSRSKYFVHSRMFVSGFVNLPNDYRTLLNTPRSVEITSVGGGRLWYNGIEKNLRIVFSNLKEDKSIALTFNVDGLPLFKNSKRCFWPILATVHSK